MANPSGQKGTKWETAVVSFLKACGLLARRVVKRGSKDEGDLVVEDVPGIAIEAKNCRGASLAEWVDEAVREAENAGVPVGVVWHHRRGKASPGDGYVTMSGEHFVKLLKELQWARRQL